MTELSIIIPYCNEWPQVLFTIRSIAEELSGIDFEIIAVDNWCKEAEIGQKRMPDRGHARWKLDKTFYGQYRDHPKDAVLATSHLYRMAKKHWWMKYVAYDEKLSHWNAKRIGVEHAQSRFLWFMDAHVLPSAGTLAECFEYYKRNWQELEGSMHLPLTYHILESKRLIYKPKIDTSKGDYHYSFQTLDYAFPTHRPFEVPCMSTCGMLIARELYDYTGGWPKALGIYGGGENFMNYTLTVLGKKKWIWPHGILYHHGDKRGYNWNGSDFDRNRLVATYLFGGEGLANKLAEIRYRGSPRGRRATMEKIYNECEDQRDLISSRTVVNLNDWAKSVVAGKWKPMR